MKKVLISLLMFAGCIAASFAQKFALVDMEYIMKNLGSYEVAQTQLEKLSQSRQKEVETVQKQAEAIYKQYQAERPYLSPDDQKRYEEAITAKEKEASELRYKYFGPEGELYKKREAMIEPIQNQVYEAIKEIADQNGFQAIFDRATSANIIYASPRIDISEQVLAKLLN
ncbi:MAG: OmpH family outer membrane protein [Muribaculaceae bacterium]|nr:OmpH family outer membrane protein [Muribaculaceae bacterium]MDE6352462.1 OmpH family outer membrane protein [Muribaculaceae bacterium]MDE6643670.1 OmpH family outer membrane protein [Muribaculaceae bacterium]